VELARAQIAWQLGKRYIQDEELGWGAATPPAADQSSDPESLSRTLHAMTSDKEDFRKAGTTVQASRKRKRKRKS
jgi:hypothetical protein